MPPDLAIIVVLLAAAILMFAANKPRLDVVALLMLTLLPFTGVITIGEALAGFSDPNIVLIAALFVIGDGLVRTGVAQRLGDWLIARAGRNEVRLIVLLMAVVGGLGVIVPPNSDLVGKTAAEARVRSRFGLTVIGLRRGLDVHGRGLRDEAMAIGDMLLLAGTWKDIEKLRSDGGQLVVINLPGEIDEMLPAPGKALHAVACLALVVGLMISGLVPNVQAALIGCLLMGAMGCIDLTSAYRSIDWKTIVLIVGMLPFSIALQRTGGVDLAADGLRALTGNAGMHTVLAMLFAMTALLGMFISNTATAVLMAPVAIALAKHMQASPYPFAMIVALAASTAFMTPVSSPVNTLVVAPGHYAFADFLRVGVPFSLIVLSICVFLVPLLLPF